MKERGGGGIRGSLLFIQQVFFPWRKNSGKILFWHFCASSRFPRTYNKYVHSFLGKLFKYFLQNSFNDGDGGGKSKFEEKSETFFQDDSFVVDSATPLIFIGSNERRSIPPPKREKNCAFFKKNLYSLFFHVRETEDIKDTHFFPQYMYRLSLGRLLNIACFLVVVAAEHIIFWLFWRTGNWITLRKFFWAHNISPDFFSYFSLPTRCASSSSSRTASSCSSGASRGCRTPSRDPCRGPREK